MITVKNKKPLNEIICENCGAELCYEPEDKRIGYVGYEVIDCPECGEETPVSEKRIHPPKFPITFSHTCADKGAKLLSNEETQCWINEVLDKLKNYKPGEFTFVSTGDTMVIGLKFEDETDIIVTKDYYEDAIMKED